MKSVGRKASQQAATLAGGRETTVVSYIDQLRVQGNPFVGTHSRRLVEETNAGVLAALVRSPRRRARKGKNVFEYAFRYRNLGLGKRYQHESWRHLNTDAENPQCFWTVTRLVIKDRHPFHIHGTAWGILTWNGKLWHGGEERNINAASVHKWLLIDDKDMPNEMPIGKPDLSITQPQPKEQAESGVAARADEEEMEA